MSKNIIIEGSKGVKLYPITKAENIIDLENVAKDELEKKLNKEYISLDEYSFNSVKKTGFYQIKDEKTSPSKTSDNYLMYVGVSNSVIFQHAVNTWTGDTYTRSHNAQGWTEWRKLSLDEAVDDLQHRFNAHRAILVDETTDLNDVVNSGYYAGKRPKNAPVDFFYMQVLPFYNSDVIQIAYDWRNVPDFYIRGRKYSSSSGVKWSEWHKMNDGVTSVNGEKGAVKLSSAQIPMQGTSGDTILDSFTNLEKVVNNKINKTDAGRFSTYVVASDNSNANSKNGADIIINTKDDAGEIITDLTKELGDKGGKITFLEGVYHFRTPLFIGNDNIILEGMGEATEFKAASDFDTSFLSIIQVGRNAPIYSFVVRDIALNGTGKGIDGVALLFNSTSSVENVSIINCANGIRVNTTHQVGTTVNNCRIADNWKHGVVVRGGMIILKNSIIAHNKEDGFVIYNRAKDDRSVIDNNTFEDNAQGSKYINTAQINIGAASANDLTSQVIVSNNRIIDNDAATYGIYASGDENLFSNNTFIGEFQGLITDKGKNNIEVNTNVLK